MNLNKKKLVLTIKIVYLILSACLISLTLAHIIRLADLSVNPIFFDGGVLYSLVKSETHHDLYYMSDGPRGCFGIWDCSKKICEKYVKGPGKIVAMKINPSNLNGTSSCAINHNEWNWANYKYSICTIMILVSGAISIIALLSKLTIIILDYINDNNNSVYNVEEIGEINRMYESNEPKLCNWRNIIWIVLIVLVRICILVTAAVFYWYLIGQQIDFPPKYIQNLEYGELCVMLFATVLDGFISMALILF